MPENNLYSMMNRRTLLKLAAVTSGGIILSCADYNPLEPKTNRSIESIIKTDTHTISWEKDSKGDYLSIKRRNNNVEEGRIYLNAPYKEKIEALNGFISRNNLRASKIAIPQNIDDVVLSYSLNEANGLYLPKPSISDIQEHRASDISWLAPLRSDFGIRDGKVDLEDFFAFALAFGLRKGQEGYESRFDLNKNGVIDLDDFFDFALDFGKAQKKLEITELSHLLYPAGTIRVKHPAIPDVNFIIPAGMAASKVADGSYFVIDLDGIKFMGKDVDVKIIGVDYAGEEIIGGRERTRVPNHYLSLELKDSMRDANGYYQLVLNMPNTIPPDLFFYGESGNNLGNFLMILKNPKVAIGRDFDNTNNTFAIYVNGKREVLSSVVQYNNGRYIMVTNLGAFKNEGVIVPGPNPIELRARGGADLKRFVVADTYSLKP